MKEGLKRLLHDKYRNDITSFIDKFVHPTQSLLSDLQEQVFVYCIFVNDKLLVEYLTCSIT